MWPKDLQATLGERMCQKADLGEGLAYPEVMISKCPACFSLVNVQLTLQQRAVRGADQPSS